MRLKLCFAFFVFAVATVTAQVDYSDEDAYWWSDEVPADQLGRVEIKDKPAKDASPEEDLYDDNFDENQPEESFLDSETKNKEILLEGLESQQQLHLNENFEESNEQESLLGQLDKLNEPNKNSDDVPTEDIANSFVEKEDSSQEVKDEIEQFRKILDETEVNDDEFKDYQIEDNRSQNKYENKNLPSDNEGSFENEADLSQEFGGNLDQEQDEESNIDDIISETQEILSAENSPNEEDFEDIIKDQENAELSAEDTNNKEIIASDKKTVDEDMSQENDEFFDDIIENQQNENINSFLSNVRGDNDFDDEYSEKEMDTDNIAYDEIVNSAAQDSDSGMNQEKPEQQNISNSQEERGQALDESIKYENDMINANDAVSEDKNNLGKELSEEQIDTDEDTVDKVYADLHDDLEKLFDTWDKLTDDSKDSNEGVVEYEEKYGVPFREGVVLSQRDDYDNYGDINDETFDSNLADIFNNNKPEKSSESDEDFDYAENAMDTFKHLEKILSEDPDPEKEEVVLLKAGPEQKEVLQEQASSPTESTTEQAVSTTDSSSTVQTVRKVDVDDLPASQYTDLMAQFAAMHTEEIDTFREDFGKSIAPVHMQISYDHVTEITSPNYPSTYPTNNVIDWILEGDGTGIELNVTDLELRGALDDFLLIKPGGADDTGHNGLLFSYHLNEPRSYRFTDVNRVFIRFNSGAGLGFLKGFRLTVKNIWPAESFDSDEEPPTAEPLLPPPPATLTVYLGGLGWKEFLDTQEQFRRIIADMATMYINANGLEAGMNSTSDVTQLTNIAYCNVNWPDFDICLEVTFGVPLVHEDEAPSRLNEEDLRNMWETYAAQDPVAARLRQMGITEFAVPDEGRVMLAWSVLACGVILSAALLAFALWRYSCFDNYTRMKTFSDTDSLRDEKRGLDLYPTPHQTLPPLYADTDYKWADEKYEDSTRVDMGGFANRSYVRDELLDIDSDEDAIPSRDRNAAIAPRDIYQV